MVMYAGTVNSRRNFESKLEIAWEGAVEKRPLVTGGRDPQLSWFNCNPRLKWAFADFDSESVKLDLQYIPNPQKSDMA